MVASKAAAYLLMAGVSKIIDARNKRLPPPPYGEFRRRNNKRRKTKNGKDDMGGVGNEEQDEIQECEKEDESDPSLLDNIR